jgi:hypothetical protein
MIQNVIHKHLCLYAYKTQLKHETKYYDFANVMLNKTDDHETFLCQICFTDEATFHMNGCVNRHNRRIWVSEQPNEFYKVKGKAKTSNIS